jgi:hypothetical protein
MAEEFVLNRKVCVEVDTTPTGSARTWARLAVGITSAIDSWNDSKDNTAYLNGGGYGNTDIIGKQYMCALTGHRVTGNVAQDFIVSLQNKFGDEAKTWFRYTKSNGKRILSYGTFADIADAGGDANAKSDFSANFEGCGEPTVSEPTSAPALTATVAAGSVVGATKFTATAGAENTLAYVLTPAAKTANLYSHPGTVVAYTSAADIPAVVGQYLNMYELDANGRVVKFLSEVLESADINPGT